jgi:hypothetical protein
MWAQLLGVFGLSMIKFMLAPFGGPALGLNFIETYLASVSGAVFSSTIFYFASDFFFKRAAEKKLKSLEVSKNKKMFTKTNKFVVKMKRNVGIIGVSFLAPFFLSIPIGTIITAKFYGKRHITYPLILLGIGVMGLITTGLAYFVFS